MRRPNKWFYLRLGIVAVFAAGGLSFPQEVEAIPWFIVLLTFFVSFVGLFIQSWICLYRGGSRYMWRSPSWYENPFTHPFRHTQPLQFFHLGAFCLMSFALASLTSAPWNWAQGFPLPFFFLSGGFGVWVFVRVFCLVFAKKMGKSNHSFQPSASNAG